MTFWSGAQDLLEGGLDVATTWGPKVMPLWGAAKAAKHGLQGIYSAVTGDHEGTIDNGADFLTDVVGLLPGVGLGVGLASGTLGTLGSMVTDDAKFPNAPEAVGFGVKSLFNDWFHPNKSYSGADADALLHPDQHPDAEPKTDAQKQPGSKWGTIGGLLGGLGGLAAGPLGAMAGATVGHAVGDWWSSF